LLLFTAIGIYFHTPFNCKQKTSQL
jgi:hypothetical protein